DISCEPTFGQAHDLYPSQAGVPATCTIFSRWPTRFVHASRCRAGVEADPLRRARVSGRPEPDEAGANDQPALTSRSGQRPATSTKRRKAMTRTRRSLLIVLAISMLWAAPAAAAALDLNGAFSTFVVKPDFVSLCPSGVADECGVMELVG